MNKLNPIIKVFTTPHCTYCKIVKGYLNNLNISFEEIDLTNNSESMEWLVNSTGQMGVPVTFFNDSKFIIGWQKEAIDDHLKELKLI